MKLGVYIYILYIYAYKAPAVAYVCHVTCSNTVVICTVCEVSHVLYYILEKYATYSLNYAYLVCIHVYMWYIHVHIHTCTVCIFRRTWYPGVQYNIDNIHIIYIFIYLYVHVHVQFNVYLNILSNMQQTDLISRQRYFDK